MTHPVHAALLSLLFVTAVAAQPCALPSPTADDVAVQALLDGGGVVQLDPRVYYTSSPWIVGSNTHLRGAGRGLTIIRGNTVIVGKIVHGVNAGGTIASVGQSHVTVSDLTIDHRTCARPGNGIEFRPRDNDHTGIVPTKVLVENVEVLGSGNPKHHAYMIWNFKGRGVKIINNWVDGGLREYSNQEGIESFGGYDVLISGNSVKSIGTACINLGSADVGNSETDSITVTNNYLSECGIGINLGTSNATHGPQSTSHIRLANNTIVGPRVTGIDIVAAPGTTMSDIAITGNSISNLSGNSVVGIKMRTASSEPIGTGAVIANTVRGNQIQNVTGTNSHGIRLVSYPNVRVLNNNIMNVGNGAIYTIYSDDIELSGNRIEKGGAYAIQMHGNAKTGFARFIVQRNLIDWSGPSGAITVIGGKVGVIKDNVLKRSDDAQPPAISMANVCGVTISGNVPWYWPAWPGVTTPACP